MSDNQSIDLETVIKEMRIEFQKLRDQVRYLMVESISNKPDCPGCHHPVQHNPHAKRACQFCSKFWVVYPEHLLSIGVSWQHFRTFQSIDTKNEGCLCYLAKLDKK